MTQTQWCLLSYLCGCLTPFVVALAFKRQIRAASKAYRADEDDEDDNDGPGDTVKVS